MHPDQESQVAVFWDYEHCHHSPGVDGFDLIKRIRSIALSFGAVRSFRAYIHSTSDDYDGWRSLATRSEMQSSGITLTAFTYSPTANPSVLEKAMIVDILAYAIDVPMPFTILLITGEELDFTYAISTLTLRKYKVVVISPEGSRSGIKRNASLWMDWTTDVMSKISDAASFPYHEIGIPKSPSIAPPGGSAITNGHHNTASSVADLLMNGSGTLQDANPPPTPSFLYSNASIFGGEVEPSGAREARVSLPSSNIEHQNISVHAHPLLPADGSLTSLIHAALVTPPATTTAMLPSSSSSPSETTQNTPNDIPRIYKILVEQLRLFEARGNMRPLRSMFAPCSMAKDPDVYQKAGVKKFAQFAAMAEKASIIVLGGINGDAWLALAPELREAK